MKRDPFQTPHAKRRESEVGLEVAELPLYSDAASVEVAEPIRVARDAREQPATERERQSWLILLRALVSSGVGHLSASSGTCANIAPIVPQRADRVYAMEFLVTADSDCTVHFEPEGSQHRLAKGDAFRVQVAGVPDHLEVMHGESSLSVWIEGTDVRAWNKAGDELGL